MSTLVLSSITYTYSNTVGRHLIFSQSVFLPMPVRYCSPQQRWQDDSKSSSLRSPDPEESYPSSPHQVTGMNLFEISTLHSAIFLQSSFSLFKEALARSEIHCISICLTREWDASLFLKILLLFGLDSPGASLAGSGIKRKKAVALPSTRSTAHNSHDAHFPFWYFLSSILGKGRAG